MIKLAALWRKEKANGEEYLIGKLGDATLIAFQNNYKQADNHPDYLVYVQMGEHQKNRENKNSGSGGHKGGFKGGGSEEAPF